MIISKCKAKIKCAPLSPLRRNSGPAKVGAADPAGVAVREARRDRGRRRGLRVGASDGADDGGGRRRVRRAVTEVDGRGGALVQGEKVF